MTCPYSSLNSRNIDSTHSYPVSYKIVAQVYDHFDTFSDVIPCFADLAEPWLIAMLTEIWTPQCEDSLRIMCYFLTIVRSSD
jgi:hypothetical protein